MSLGHVIRIGIDGLMDNDNDAKNGYILLLLIMINDA